MSVVTEKRVKSEPDRRYFEIGDFEIRTGRFNDPNAYFNGEKWEIRILSKDFELMQVLEEKLKEMLQETIVTRGTSS
jgi:hypothetical protein